MVDDIRSGFQVVGNLVRSNVFPNKLVPASMTVQELRSRAQLARKTIINKVRSSGDESDRLLWETTLQERDSGWLTGPFDEDEVSRIFGTEQWNVTRRFLIIQGGKPRIIDDGRESNINAALTTHEKLTLMDVDSVACALRAIAEALTADNGGFSVCFEDGSAINGSVHPDFLSPGKFEWLGKTLDLKTAYKQMGYKEDQLWTAVLAAYCPQKVKLSSLSALLLCSGPAALCTASTGSARLCGFCWSGWDAC